MHAAGYGACSRCSSSDQTRESRLTPYIWMFVGKHVCWQSGSEGHVGALQVSAEQQHICSTYTYIHIPLYRGRVQHRKKRAAWVSRVTPGELIKK